MAALVVAQVQKRKVAENIIFGGQLTTVAPKEGGDAVCSFKGAHAMVVEGCGPCSAPVPAGYMVA